MTRSFNAAAGRYTPVVRLAAHRGQQPLEVLARRPARVRVRRDARVPLHRVDSR
jgi:hypothetical protein